MDPMLAAILQSSDPARLLQREERPAWSRGLGERRPSVRDPLVAGGRFAAPTPEVAQASTVRTALEGDYEDKSFAGKAARLIGKLLLGSPRETKYDAAGRPKLDTELADRKSVV